MRNILINLCRIIPDTIYLKLLYYKNTRQVLNLNNPMTYNEKLQWLKIHDRKPGYTLLVDKYEVRKYIKSIIGEQYLVPLIGVWNRASEIDFSKLPKQFVLKCNHDSKSTIICKDKSKLDIRKTVKELNKKLKNNAFWYGREWPYKNVKPRVIAEEFLKDPIYDVPVDYKVMCFNGKAKLIQVHCGRGSDKYTQDFYDNDWNYIPIDQEINLSSHPLARPLFLEELLFLSEILAEGLIHVRIDWYFVNNQLYFGEVTFFDGSGFVPFVNKEDNILLGSMIQLSF